MRTVFETSEFYPKYIIPEKNIETLLLGSSTISRNLDPKVFESTLGGNAYSMAKDGTGLFYSTLLLNELPEQSSSLKYIVLGIDPAAFINGFKSSNFKRVERLKPLYWYDSELSEFLDGEDKWAVLKKSLVSYPYRGVYRTIMMDKLKGKSGLPGNFSPLYGHMQPETNEVADGQPKPLAPESLRALEIIAQTMAKQSAKLVLISTPFYGGRQRAFENQYSQVMQTIHEKLSAVNVCDLTQFTSPELMTFSMNHKMFFDGAHMNNEGAFSYSQIIAQRIAEDCIH